jgi:hypothetical protein
VAITSGDAGSTGGVGASGFAGISGIAGIDGSLGIGAVSGIGIGGGAPCAVNATGTDASNSADTMKRGFDWTLMINSIIDEPKYWGPFLQHPCAAEDSSFFAKRGSTDRPFPTRHPEHAAKIAAAPGQPMQKRLIKNIRKCILNFPTIHPIG